MTKSNQVAKPRFVVVGGGYGGITAAKALDETSDVVLIEPKDAFMHNIAALRALVDPTWLPRISCPTRGCSPTAAWFETEPSWWIHTGW